MSKEACLHVKRDLFPCQKKPIHMSKETYSHVKRDLFTCQKRAIYMSKETYLHVKRDLFTCQKRAIYMSKETYLHVKRPGVQRDLATGDVSRQHIDYRILHSTHPPSLHTSEHIYISHINYCIIRTYIYHISINA